MHPKTDIIIVGGSIAGLMVANVCKARDYNVLVIEKALAPYSKDHAAGLGLGSWAQQVLKRFVPSFDLETSAIPNPTSVFLNATGSSITSRSWKAHDGNAVVTSTWGTVYSALLQSLGEKNSSNGSVVLQTGRRVVQADLKSEGWEVTYETEDGLKGIERADLLIAADGAHSTVRRLVLPNLEPTYSGYLAWGGSFTEKEIPPQIKGVLKGKLL